MKRAKQTDAAMDSRKGGHLVVPPSCRPREVRRRLLAGKWSFVHGDSTSNAVNQADSADLTQSKTILPNAESDLAFWNVVFNNNHRLSDHSPSAQLSSST